MSVRELSRDQLTELKQNHYVENRDHWNLDEFWEIDKHISDEEIFEAYEHIEFVQDDFFCSQVTNDPTDLTLINKED